MLTEIGNFIIQVVPGGIGVLIGFLVGKKKRAAETTSAVIDARKKEEEYQEQRYEKLSKRLQHSDAQIEKLIANIDSLNNQLKAVMMERDEIRVEFNLYKTLKS